MDINVIMIDFRDEAQRGLESRPAEPTPDEVRALLWDLNTWLRSRLETEQQINRA
ncbi:MAG: hypothetical protein KAS66_05395 [Candidatus Omnitrophica bacterium]|nr:hypothetical protein [Candidatus Omnitrophota bacterium]